MQSCRIYQKHSCEFYIFLYLFRIFEICDKIIKLYSVKSNLLVPNTLNTIMVLFSVNKSGKNTFGTTAWKWSHTWKPLSQNIFKNCQIIQILDVLYQFMPPKPTKIVEIKKPFFKYLPFRTVQGTNMELIDQQKVLKLHFWQPILDEISKNNSQIILRIINHNIELLHFTVLIVAHEIVSLPFSETRLQ